ncbi:MAG: hypothetical protein ACSLFR_09070 [Solirubrobacteraceae bacterium]
MAASPPTGPRGALSAGGLGVALGLAAWGFDAEPLWVAAGALIALPLLAAVSVVLSARRATVTRTLGVPRVQEGEEVPVRIEVRAAGLPFPGGEVRDDLIRRPVELRAGGRGVRIDARARFDRRGVHRLSASRVVVSDPLGLYRREVPGVHDEADLLVLPRIEPVLADGAGSETGRRARGRVTGLAATELDGVGALRDGTPASRVYWHAVARGGDPLERRFRPDGDGRPLIALDARSPASTEDLDAAVRAAASLAVHLAGEGGCWLLLPDSRRPVAIEPSLGGWPALHARLALVTDRAAPALAELAGRRGAIVLVSARRRDGPPAALRHGGASPVLVVPGVLPGRRASFTVAGCTGYAQGRPARRISVGAVTR